MTDRAPGVDRAAERLVDIDHVSYGDERERSLYMEAATFGMMLGVWACFIGSFVFALFGEVLVPVVLIAVSMVPAYGTLWYAERRGVQPFELLRVLRIEAASRRPSASQSFCC